MHNWYKTQLNTSWLKENHIETEWLLSPSSNSIYRITMWQASGDVNHRTANLSDSGLHMMARPSLYLNSSVLISRGDGTKNNPYELYLPK